MHQCFYTASFIFRDKYIGGIPPWYQPVFYRRNFRYRCILMSFEKLPSIRCSIIFPRLSISIKIVKNGSISKKLWSNRHEDIESKMCCLGQSDLIPPFFNYSKVELLGEDNVGRFLGVVEVVVYFFLRSSFLVFLFRIWLEVLLGDGRCFFLGGGL